MAYAMTKQGSLDNCVTYEFICDTITDMNAIENRYRTIGSVAVVLQGESDGLEVYIAGSDKQWNNLGSMGAASNSQGSSSGLSIYICAQNEVSNGLPDISEPDESTIYLVPASETSGNLYNEYIYVDDNWELFGGANIDLSNYVLKNNPTMTGTLSLNRKSNTTVGELSVAIGKNVEASGNYSFATGDSTIASAQSAHAEGGGTTASGLFAHAEGSGTSAQGAYTHAEGGGSRATAPCAHAEGGGTTASGNNAHAEGGGATASGAQAHAEGNGTNAIASSAHAEGSAATASGNSSHSEGVNTLASGDPSHAEGTSTVASGSHSHAEGLATAASGNSSHAEGNNTTAIGFAEHVSGQFNVIDSAPAWVANTSYVVNDIVSKETTFTDGGGVQRTRVVIYKCKIANSILLLHLIGLNGVNIQQSLVMEQHQLFALMLMHQIGMVMNI